MTAIETEQGRRLNESKVKAITGGDKISARFMRQDFFGTPQFSPSSSATTSLPSATSTKR